MHQTTTSYRKSATTALLLAAGLAAPGLAQPDMVRQGVQPVSYAGSVVQDFTIPENDPPNFLKFSVLGADGGAGQTDGCFQPGGQGATVEAQFAVGSQQGQLEPGGTIRFIIGESGEDGWLPDHGSAGAGGGGSAVLYRAPGNAGNSCDDWTILMAAGAGGGGNVSQYLFCKGKSPGKDAEVGECGGDGKDNAFHDFEGGEGGCNGTSGMNGHGDHSKGGLGAYQDNGRGLACPDGVDGNGGDDDYGSKGGWGFGGGGDALYGGGGGGGYSGGGGAYTRGGGGGGSYVASFATRNKRVVGSPGHTNGYGTYQCLDVWDTCDIARGMAVLDIPFGVPLNLATASGASASCHAATGPDLFYAYTPKRREDIALLVTPSGPTTVSVKEGCRGAEVACNWSASEQFGIAWEAQVGVEYIIRVANDAGFAGTPSIFGIVHPLSPLNNRPVNSIAIDEATTALSGSTCLATLDVSGSCDTTWVFEGDVWYRVEASDACATNLSLWGWPDRFAVSVHEADLTELVCSTDGRLDVQIAAGSEYYVRVAGEASPLVDNNHFEIGVDLQVVSPDNDEPENAAVFLPGDMLAGNMCGASYGEYLSTCAAGDAAVWYTYTNSTGSCETIDFSWSPDGITAVSIHDPVTFEQLDGQCSDDGLLTAAAPAGRSLLVRVGGEPSVSYSIATAVSSADSDGDGVTDGCDSCPGTDDLIDCDNNLIGDCSELDHPGRFEDFSGQGQMAYTLNSNDVTDPVVSNGSLRLTQAESGERASAVFETVSALSVGSFTASFDFKIGEGTGADGMCFSVMDAGLYDETALFGESGPGAGALTVTLDTYIGNPNDGNHAQLRWDGTLLASELVGFTLDDNQWHHAEIEFDGTNLALTLTPAGGTPETFFTGVPVPGFAPFVARYGVGARTGGANNKHSVDNIRFIDTTNTNDDDGDGIINPCDSSCYADFNDDGNVNTLDMLAFLNAWNANDTAADCNEDGSINTLDVLCFLNLWNSGC